VPKRGYRDFQEHLAELEKAGLLRTVDRAINKDTELHPLVRWQFRGGIPEADRKAWKFDNVVDSKGRSYDMPVVVGALATTPDIYRIGMNIDLDKIGEHWEHAIAHPIPPIEVENAACQEVVITGEDLIGEGKGLDALPIPISTPGYDCAPYFTATNCTTKDPETGVQNMGTYRAGLKASNRLGVRMASRTGGAGGYFHWCKYQERGKKMPCAFVVGAPPHVAFTGPQKLPRTTDEMEVAGGLAGEPIHIVKCKTVDLMVPADAELVVEGYVETDYLEPEAPFGESHGHIALEEFNMQMNVTAITHKTKPVLASIISQVTPSESSVIKRVAYEPMFMAHLRDNLGIQGIKGVALHEPLTNLRKVTFIQMARGSTTTEVWRALYGIANFRADCGKYVIAVSEDIDPLNGDAVFWSITYRANPTLDVHVLKHRAGGHGPHGGHGADSTMLIDATIKADMPPIALPKKEYMEKAKALWERLGLPELKPEAPWHGYELGDWNDYWDEMAARATAGDYKINGQLTQQRLVQGVKPETLVSKIEAEPGKPKER
jgi:UbiD family decarboxylase